MNDFCEKKRAEAEQKCAEAEKKREKAEQEREEAEQECEVAAESDNILKFLENPDHQKKIRAIVNKDYASEKSSTNKFVCQAMMNKTIRKIASDTQAAKSFCIPRMKKLKIAELDRDEALKAFMRIVHDGADAADAPAAAQAAASA